MRKTATDDSGLVDGRRIQTTQGEGATERGVSTVEIRTCLRAENTKKNTEIIGSEATILLYPRNRLAFVNESVEFQCNTDTNKSIQWSVTFSGTTQSTRLFVRGNLTSPRDSKYRIIASNYGQYDLIIDSVDFSHAGKYKCSEGSFGSYEEAELAVIDARPSCKSNACSTDNSIVESDCLHVQMQCNFSFSGNVTPRVDWTRTSTGNVLNYTVNRRNQFVTNHQSVIDIKMNCSDNNDIITFKATFNQENNSNENVISWNYTVEVMCSAPTQNNSSAAVLGSIVTAIILCVTIGIVVIVRRLSVKASAARLREPDVVSNDMYMTHYYDIADLSNEGAVGMTVMSPEYNDARQVEAMFPVYDLIRGEGNETSTGGLNSPQEVRSPTYTEVNKKDRGQGRINGEMLRAEQRTEVYSEIPDTNLPVSKTHQDNNSCDQSSTQRKVKPTNYFGADGTEYAEVKSFPEERPAAPMQRPPMFLPVENYASIDHTQRALPPPPRL